MAEVSKGKTLPALTFQVLEGIDKGRIFRELCPPVTIGREEGNLLRLNDERVSRYHAKVQYDNGEIILTDLDSTNGTRVNGTVIQIRRLRAGDRVGVGRSLLLFGSQEEIEARMVATGLRPPPGARTGTGPQATIQAEPPASLDDPQFELNLHDEMTIRDGSIYMGKQELPPLPQKMSPSQAARLAELIDFLHRQLTAATENIQANDEGTEVRLTFADWQRVLAVQMLLARYVRAVAEPDALTE
jgi:pSer/pThr/pTyr-binding forkhead associated (FHA) protein